jgi:hypothetical protein
VWAPEGREVKRFNSRRAGRGNNKSHGRHAAALSLTWDAAGIVHVRLSVCGLTVREAWDVIIDFQCGGGLTRLT